MNYGGPWKFLSLRNLGVKRAPETPLTEESRGEEWRALETPLHVLFSRSFSALFSQGFQKIKYTIMVLVHLAPAGLFL